MKAYLILILAVMLPMLSCSVNKTNPTEPQAGRREYVWEIDTIKIPFTYLSRIWGEAADNVWAVGPGGGLDKTIWRFDGSNWTTDGISRIISPIAIWGFGKNNIWAAGREGHIWHFDGTWKESVWIQKTGWNIGFQEIWGDAPNQVYATGYADSNIVRRGIICKYNGVSWMELPIGPIQYNFLKIRRGESENKNYYIFGLNSSVTEGTYDGIFEFDGNTLTQKYKAIRNATTWAFVQEINDKVFFVIGNRITRLINNEFKTIFEVANPSFGLQIFGRSEKDIFLRMEDGIAHYNGSDIQYLYKFQSKMSIVDGVILENEVFFLALDYITGNNYLIHGKLK